MEDLHGKIPASNPDFTAPMKLDYKYSTPPLRLNDDAQTQTLEVDTELRGKVKFFHSEKSIGYVEPDDGGPDVFIGPSVVTGSTPIFQGLDVIFEATYNLERKQYHATCVKPADEATQLENDVRNVNGRAIRQFARAKFLELFPQDVGVMVFKGMELGARCELGHPMLPGKSKAGGTCDSCKGSIPNHEQFFECKQCRQWYCDRCRPGASGVAAKMPQMLGKLKELIFKLKGPPVASLPAESDLSGSCFL